jgi:hypothetical protein
MKPARPTAWLARRFLATRHALGEQYQRVETPDNRQTCGRVEGSGATPSGDVRTPSSR